ncbi:hypothetical protein [Isachenkonia alkalipeptolytica]|uniref:Uncharacterized protein n=1 Tax=Isachenkonia alkalipeptolytica TaxID=2565777 RepID=A0AA43XKC8_9CLOT|nr:hypothetical protein [Isachenkonia alkalipeptolytica]NBG88237.1 hypothetical protein [Isachenkonia alkalipeptolytica]
MKAEKIMWGSLTVQMSILVLILISVLTGRPVSNLLAGAFGVSMFLSILSSIFVRNEKKKYRID